MSEFSRQNRTDALEKTHAVERELAKAREEVGRLEKGRSVMFARLAQRTSIIGAKAASDSVDEKWNPWVKGNRAKRVVSGFLSSKHKAVACVIQFGDQNFRFADVKGEPPKFKEKNTISYDRVLSVQYGMQTRAVAMWVVAHVS